MVILVAMEENICANHSQWSTSMNVSKTVLLENVEHCGGEPEQAANMHMNKFLAEMISCTVCRSSLPLIVSP